MLTSVTEIEIQDEEFPRPALPSWGVMLKQLNGVPCNLPAVAVPERHRARTHLFDGPDEE
jgi:hypothetical protein